MKTYKIGQEVELKDGRKATVVELGSTNHNDIRPPYHRAGYPTIKVVGSFGRIKLIPNDWKCLYVDEAHVDILK